MESDEQLAELFRKLLDVLPPGDSGERAFAMSRLGVYLAGSGSDPPQGDDLTRQGLDMARRIGQPRNLARVIRARMTTLFGLPLQGTVQEAQGVELALAEELERVAPPGLIEDESIPLRIRLGFALSRGDMAAARSEIAALEALARTYRSNLLDNWARSTRRALPFCAWRTRQGCRTRGAERRREPGSQLRWVRYMTNPPTSAARVLSAVGRSLEAEQRFDESGLRPGSNAALQRRNPRQARRSAPRACPLRRSSRPRPHLR